MDDAMLLGCESSLVFFYLSLRFDPMIFNVGSQPDKASKIGQSGRSWP